MTNKIPKILTSFHLKMIALITMFIDHFSFVYLNGLITNDNQVLLLNIAHSMRLIGRIAFPIYCFLIVEGFLHTKNINKYILRLLIFAFISEIPFDLAINNCLIEFHSNNVLFTLLLGLILIYIVSLIEKKQKKYLKRNKNILIVNISSKLLIILTTFVFCLLANNVFSSDYGASGIISIFFMYVLREKPILSSILSICALVLLNFAFNELYALIIIIPLLLYNGKKGKSVKYFFYWFYPLHLLFLYFLSNINII